MRRQNAMKRLLIVAALLGAAVICSGLAGAASLQPARVDMSDVVIGAGGAGPFALSWNNIAVASERVEVNGVPLLRGIDYTIDWTKGTITFARPLPANSAAHVTYLRQPGQSQPNQQSVDLPAAIPLGDLAGANLALAVRFQQDASAGPRGVYGLRAGHTGATKVDAAFFFSEAGATAGRSDAGAGQASGWRIGAQRSYSQLDLAASLTRAQQGFSAPKDLPATAGMQTLNLAAKYRASRSLTARASVTDAEDIATASHATTRTTELGLAAKPLTGAEIDLSRTEAASEQTSGSVATITDRAQAKLALGRTTASASYQQSVTGDARSDTQSLRVASSLRHGLSVVASHIESDSDTAHQRGSEVGLDVATWRQARLRAIAGARRGDTVEDYHGVEATVKPAAQLTLSGAYKERDYGETMLNTRKAAVAVAPVKHLEIGGEYAENPEDDAGNVRQATSTKVRVATQLGIVGLSGSVGREIAVAGDEQRAGEVRLSLKIAGAHNVYTGYRQTETVPLGSTSTDATEVYMLGYSYALGGDFSLALEGQLQRDRSYQQLRNDEQRADAKLNWRF
jgi:hypothetical protein